MTSVTSSTTDPISTHLINTIQQIDYTVEYNHDCNDLYTLCKTLTDNDIYQIKQHKYNMLQQFLEYNHSSDHTKLQLVKQRYQLQLIVIKLIQLLCHTSNLSQIDSFSIEQLLHDVHVSSSNTSCIIAFTPQSTVYYKLVAVIGNRLYSVYDGTTEYIIGTTLHYDNSGDRARSDNYSGYYISSTIIDALTTVFPAESKLIQCPRALIQCNIGSDVKPISSHMNHYISNSITPTRILLRLNRHTNKLDYTTLHEFSHKLQHTQTLDEPNIILQQLTQKHKPAFKCYMVIGLYSADMNQLLPLTYASIYCCVMSVSLG